MPNGVVVGFDGSDRARDAVWWAADEARRRDRPLTLVRAHGAPVPTVAHAWGPVVTPGGAAAATGLGPAELLAHDRVREHAEQELAALADECRTRVPGLAVDTEAGEGRAAAVLLAAADQRDAALLVVGATGLSALPRAVLGSTTAELVHDAGRPVVVVRGDHTGRDADAPVVLGTGGTEAADNAVGFAFEFAARHDCPLRVVHAWSDSPLDVLATLGLWELGSDTDEVAERIDEYVLREERQRHPEVSVRVDVVHDRPARALLDQAGTARLLVVGSRGRGPVRRALLGSVSHAALYHASCPVAVVP
ncbi:universal stress protein [Actinophytocola glycyrrhizae]|uniref:Universal stress protein n=1 Tax=Actinophytocola glycyrrhizae TaxID=2044873 RepID=A0ABV9RV31_9PSEU